MPRPRFEESTAEVKLRVPVSVLATLEQLCFNHARNAPEYGLRGRVVTILLRQFFSRHNIHSPHNAALADVRQLLSQEAPTDDPRLTQPDSAYLPGFITDDDIP